MNLKNISDIYVKLDALDGLNESEAANVVLEKCKGKVNYSDYSICPKELLGYGTTARKDISSMFNFTENLVDCLSRIRGFVDKVVAIDNTSYDPDDTNSEPVPSGDGNDDDGGRTGNLTLTDDPEVPTGDPGNESSPSGDISDPNIENVNGGAGAGAGAAVGGVIAGTSDDEVGGKTGFEETNESVTGTLVVNDENAVITDENGNIVAEVTEGEYTVYEVKYDENGNPIAVRISPDGEPARWIELNQNGVDVGLFIESGQDGMYTLTEGTLNIYDENGNVIGVLHSGEYRVYDVNYDEFGNPIAIRISRDGEPEQWVNICENGTCIGTYTPNPLFGEQIINLDNDAGKLSLFNKKTATAGGIIGILAIAAGAALCIKNKKGEKVKDAEPGEYDVYDVYQDETGKITDARISSSSEDEYWVHF